MEIPTPTHQNTGPTRSSWSHNGWEEIHAPSEAGVYSSEEKGGEDEVDDAVTKTFDRPGTESEWHGPLGEHLPCVSSPSLPGAYPDPYEEGQTITDTMNKTKKILEGNLPAPEQIHDTIHTVRDLAWAYLLGPIISEFPGPHLAEDEVKEIDEGKGIHQIVTHDFADAEEKEGIQQREINGSQASGEDASASDGSFFHVSEETGSTGSTRESIGDISPRGSWSSAEPLQNNDLGMFANLEDLSHSPAEKAATTDILPIEEPVDCAHLNLGAQRSAGFSDNLGGDSAHLAEYDAPNDGSRSMGGQKAIKSTRFEPNLQELATPTKESVQTGSSKGSFLGRFQSPGSGTSTPKAIDRGYFVGADDFTAGPTAHEETLSSKAAEQPGPVIGGRDPVQPSEQMAPPQVKGKSRATDPLESDRQDAPPSESRQSTDGERMPREESSAQEANPYTPTDTLSECSSYDSSEKEHGKNPPGPPITGKRRSILRWLTRKRGRD